MTLLYGKSVADEINAKTKKIIKSNRITPGLAVILVGENKASHLYVRLKEKAAQDIGIKFEKFLFDSTVKEKELLELINKLNDRRDINGIIVQLPLPKALEAKSIISQIDPRKDVDGFHFVTMKNFLDGYKKECPVFPRAVVELLLSSKEDIIGEKGIVLVNSDIFGKIMKQALLNEGVKADYILFKNIDDNKEKIKEAEIVVTVCGVPNLIKPEMVNDGVIIIDGGISYLDGNVTGDVERISVEQKVKFLSPVPGGVGPVTVATLLARVAEVTIQDF